MTNNPTSDTGPDIPIIVTETEDQIVEGTLAEHASTNTTIENPPLGKETRNEVDTESPKDNAETSSETHADARCGMAIVETLKSQLQVQGVNVKQDGVHAEIPEIYRLDVSSLIIYPDADQTWRTAPGSSLGSILTNLVKDFEGDADDWNNYVQRVRTFLLDSRNIDLCLKVAGCKPGLLSTPDGKKILVSRDSGWMEPVEGDWSSLRDYLLAMLGERGMACLLDWLHLTLDDLRRCREVGPYLARLRPHQAMIIIGPAGCGKSLLKSLIVKIFGGSTADPAPFLFGETRFNEEVASAVTLVIDDGTDSFNPMARSRLAQGLKRLQVVGEYRVEQKGSHVVMLRACQRIVILANEDATNTLPLINESYRDKLHVLQATGSDLVGKWTNEADKNAWVERLEIALPAMSYYLLNEHKVPSERYCPRYGMKAVHSERLLSLMVDDDATELIHGMIQYTLSALKPPNLVSLPGCPNIQVYHWEGRASELFALVQKRCNQNVVAKALRSIQQFGTELGKLAMRKPKVYAKSTYNKGNQQWTVDFSIDYTLHRRLCDQFAPNLTTDNEMEDKREELGKSF